MRIQELLIEIEQAGVGLAVRDGKLFVRDPGETLPQEARAGLREHKGVLARLLTFDDGVTACRACRAAIYWKSVYGVLVCGICHPPPDPGFVQQWVTRKSPR